MNLHSSHESPLRVEAEMLKGTHRTVNLHVDPADLRPSIEQVARYLGGSGYTPNGQTRENIAKAAERAMELISPVALLAFHAVALQDEGGTLRLWNGFVLELPRHVHDHNVRAVAVGIASLGIGLETCCRALADEKQIYRSTLLDAVGTAMLDLLDDRLNCALNDHAGRRGLFAKMRFAPGLDGYPMEQQHVLFRLAGEATAEFRLNEAFVMQPTKSISFFRLLSSEKRDDISSGKCRDCQLIQCQFRMT